MDEKPRPGGLSGEEKRIFMDMVRTFPESILLSRSLAQPDRTPSVLLWHRSGMTQRTQKCVHACR
jgi:hypothetical protein